MAGGNFDINVGKTRPGVYVNVRTSKQNKPKNSTRGIAVVPLIGYDWGKNGEFIKISCDSPDAYFAKLGRSIYDDNEFMLLIREALKNAVAVYVYIINPGTKAEALAGGVKIKSVYGGTRGNDITVSSVANIDGGFDITVRLGIDVVESYEGIADVGELLKASKGRYVNFSVEDQSAVLTAFSATTLAGGTDGDVTNTDITGFLDKLEGIKWHTLCFPSDEKELQTACITKIKNLRENVGKWVQAAIPNCGADYEGIINVTNAVVLDDGTEEGKSLTAAQTCAWVAGVTAAASKTESNTNVGYEGAVGIVGIKTNEEAVLAIKNGEFFFSMSDDNKVVVEYDINSLHTFTTEKSEDYSKNRILRVYDSFAEDIAATFPPNKYDNTENGWLVMEGMGRSILQQYLDDEAIQNVSLDEDFYVDKNNSEGDETHFIVGLQAVDSAEKMYFSVSTR